MMRSRAYGMGLTAGAYRRSSGVYPTGQEIASSLTDPTEKVYLIGIGDSLLAAKTPYFCQSCYEVPWIGAIQLGSTTRRDRATIQDVEICAPANAGVLAVSPLIGGDVTWFPNGDHEVQFLGGTVLAGSVNSSISEHSIAAADFPLTFANLVGMGSRIRTVAYRHAAGTTTEPGIVMMARADADATYPVVAPNTQSAAVLDFTGSGYVSIDAAIPDSFDWAAATVASPWVLAVPGAGTTNGEIVAYHQPWLEGDGPGVVFLEWAVGGATGARYASETLFPQSLLSPSGFFATLCDEGEPVVYLSIGANSSDEVVATQEGWLDAIITKFRAWKPRCKFVLNTEHFSNNYPSCDLNHLTAMRNVAARTPGTLLLDTYLNWGNYRRGNAAGYYGDAVHLSEAGELVQCAMIGDMLHDAASGVLGRRIDFRTLPLGEGPATLPGGLALTSGVAANRTVWTGSALVNGVTANRARIGRLAIDDPPALLIEPERTNFYPFPRTVPTVGGGILAGSGETSCAASGVVGPDGGGNATRYQVNSGGYGRFLSQAGATETFTSSQYERHTSGTGENNITVSATVSEGEAVTTTWTRIQATSAGNTNFTLLGVDGRDKAAEGGVGAGARDVLVDFCQVEYGAFTTSPIPTAPATRDAEALAFPNAASTYLVGGRLKIALRLRPLAARASYKTTIAQYFWYIDADNYCLFQPASGALIVRCGGQNDGPAGAITWTADDVLEIYTETGGVANPLVAWRVNNGTLHVETGITTPTLGDGTLYVMGDGAGLATAAYIETIDIGVRPRWTVADV